MNLHTFSILTAIKTDEKRVSPRLKGFGPTLQEDFCFCTTEAS